MSRRQDNWSALGDELADWIESMSDTMVDGIVGNGPAPFAANLTQQEQLNFFHRAMFNPDGTVNITGRTQIMDHYGPVGYANILRDVLKARSIATQPARRQEPAGAY